MADAAELLAEHLVRPGHRRREPLIRYEARHEVHLHAELRHREVMEHVGRAQQRADRLIHGQVHRRRRDHDVVLAGGIRGVDAERVVDAHESHLGAAELAVLAGQPIAPVPLLADGLEVRRFLGHRDEVGPDEQTRRQHRGDADGREYGQDDLELLALGLVVGLSALALALAESPDAVRGEQVHGHEHDAADPERDVDREVDRAPVRSERREVPRAREVEDQRADHEQHQDDGQSHHNRIYPLRTSERFVAADPRER